MGFGYFWDLLSGMYKAQNPVEVLISVVDSSNPNASAFSPSNLFNTELAAAWTGKENFSGPTAGILIAKSASDSEWSTDSLTVLPEQGTQMNLPSTIVHELFHAFGLQYNGYAENSQHFWCTAADNSTYARSLHDAYGRSLGSLMDKAADGVVDITALYLLDNSDQPENPDVFYVRYDSLYSGIYFKGDHVDEVLNGATIAWPTEVTNDYTAVRDFLAPVPGLPVTGFEQNEDGTIFLEGSHIELQNSLLSHQWFRNWAVPMEAELAMLEDLGFEFDRKRYFGYSVYGSGLTIDNKQGFWQRNDAGTGWLEGRASRQAWGIGLHVYGSNNTLTQSADLLSVGAYAIGARVDGLQNNVTVASGTTIRADGLGGKGILFSWGKNHTLSVEKGATVTADGANGIALAFDFGSNLLGDGMIYLGSYTTAATDYYTGQWYEYPYIPDVLKGPLIDSLRVAGTLSGKRASIYISPNAYVKNIVIEPGARISGDIISLWDPDKTLYGTPHSGHEGSEPLVTTLVFGKSSQSLLRQPANAETPATEFHDDIISNGSIAITVASGELNMTGTASVSNVTVESGATLSGGTYSLVVREDVQNSGSLVNNGSLVSTTSRPVVIAGNYEQHANASLTLTVSGGRFVPLAVSGSAQIEEGAAVVATPAGGWHAEGLLTVDASSPVTTAADGNPASVSVSWVSADKIPASPTLKITQTAQGYRVERAEHAYSQYAAGDAADIGRILDASASSLTTQAAQDFFAGLDWSDLQGSRINKAAHALAGAGIVDGVSSVLMLDRMARDMLSADKRQANADGSYVWASPIGGRAEIRSASNASFNAAGFAGGWASSSQGSTVALSIAALEADADSKELADLDARGLWLAGSLRQQLPASNVFWESALNLGYLEAEHKRTVAFDDYSDFTELDADFWSLGAGLKAGLTLPLGDSISLEPFAQLAGSFIFAPSADEKSAGVAALSIESETYRSLEAKIGFALQGASSSSAPFWRLHASYGRELLSDAGTFTAGFVNPDFKGSFERTIDWDSRNRLRAGFALGVENANGVSVHGRIEGYRESADSHALMGSVEVRWRF